MAHLFMTYDVLPILRHQSAKYLEHLALQEHTSRAGDILRSFPDMLQGELCSAMREPYITKHALLRYLAGGFNVLFKRVCQRAVSQCVIPERESIFSVGELRTAMIFVEAGHADYMLNRGSESSGLRMQKAFFVRPGSHRNLSLHGGAERVDVAQWLCEGALFLRWHAMGDASVTRGTSLLLLDACAFAIEVSRFSAALVDVALYAHHLARCSVTFTGISDRTDFINMQLQA
jgi:hypothetical protein